MVSKFVLVEYHNLPKNHFSLEVGGREQGNPVTRQNTIAWVALLAK